MTDPYPTPFDGWPAPTCKNPSLTWCQTTPPVTSTPPASQTFSLPTTPPAVTTTVPAATTATVTTPAPELPVTGPSAGAALIGALVLMVGCALLVAVAKLRSS